MAVSPVPERLRILVASEHALVAEAVRAALTSRGHEAAVIGWPGDSRRGPRQRREPPAAPVAEVGLLLSDLDRWSRIRAAMQVVEQTRVPWVVLTTAPRGPAWGAVLAAGCRVVMPERTGLDRVGDVLWSVARQRLTTPADEQAELEVAWRETNTRHQELADRLARLTPREREVLRLMYAGHPVSRIAEIFGVAPATVRSQVKAVLRKLDVNSQLAAVAVFDDVLDVFEPRTASGRRAP